MYIRICDNYVDTFKSTAETVKNKNHYLLIHNIDGKIIIIFVSNIDKNLIKLYSPPNYSSWPMVIISSLDYLQDYDNFYGFKWTRNS